MMDLDNPSLFLVLASFALTFTVARLISRRMRARRAAQKAERDLAGQSRQVRRAAERKKKR